MKKLIYTLFLASFLMFAACNSISTGVKAINNCCKELSGNNANGTYSDEEKNKALEDTKSSSLLPFNSWDTKMMIW